MKLKDLVADWPPAEWTRGPLTWDEDPGMLKLASVGEPGAAGTFDPVEVAGKVSDRNNPFQLAEDLARTFVPIPLELASIREVQEPFAGDPDRTTSTSALLAVQVVPAPAYAFIESDANPARYGDPVRLLVTVTSPDGTPTGSVAISDGTGAFATCTGAGGVLRTNVNERSSKMVISTGMMVPAWASVAALYCFTKSMICTPCGPSAVPTGGAGVALPAGIWILTIAVTFFFAMTDCFLVQSLLTWPKSISTCVSRPKMFTSTLSFM